jgi:hypothetical protein
MAKLTQLVMYSDGVRIVETSDLVKIVAGRNLEYYGKLHTKESDMGKVRSEIEWAIQNYHKLSDMNGYIFVDTKIDRFYIDHPNQPRTEIEGRVVYQALKYELVKTDEKNPQRK